VTAYRLIEGDCRASLRTLPDESIQTCVTSPPYFGLRDYGHAGQIGLEPTPDAFVAQLVDVFREVRRVLKDDGVLWLNLGDSYAGSGKGINADGTIAGGVKQRTSKGTVTGKLSKSITPDCKPKDLIGIPWRVAFALQADGWYLRQDIIWHKPNPMPESVRDRCTKAHEYLFLLAKSERYYYDAEAISESVAESTIQRLNQPTLKQQNGSTRVPGKTNGNMKAVGGTESRNRRSVWTVPTSPYSGAHFATFPAALIEPCILAGSRVGDTVLDPFNGAATTGVVSIGHGRHYIGCELNPAYLDLSRDRLRGVAPLLTCEVVA
jgi:DNA modification methylase